MKLKIVFISLFVSLIQTHSIAQNIIPKGITIDTVKSKKYGNELYFIEGYASIKVKNKYGFVNKQEQFIIPAIYDTVNIFSEGFAPVMKNQRWGFINTSGLVVIPIKYSFLFNYWYEDAVSLMYQGKWGSINKKGKVIVPFKYDFVFEFSNGMAQVELNHKYGFFNRKGRLVIPIIYDHADPYFKDGKVSATLGNKKMILDTLGNTL